MAEEYIEAEKSFDEIGYTSPGFITKPGDRIIKPIERIDNEFHLPVEPREPIDRITISPIIGKPIKPITGSPGPGIFGLMLSLSDIEEMIPKLRQASTDLRDTWSKTINSTLAKIENSWAGDDAKVYIERVKSMDPQVDKVCQAIDLLAQSYQKVLDNSRDKTLIVKEAISRVTF